MDGHLARTPCACTNLERAAEVTDRIVVLVEETNPLHPLAVNQYVDGRSQYGWEVIYYVKQGHEVSTDLQANKGWALRCQDRIPIWMPKWAQALTLAGTHLEGVNGTKRLSMVRGTARRMVTEGEEGFDEAEVIGGQAFLTIAGTRLYPRATYLTSCNNCRRVSADFDKQFEDVCQEF